MVNYLDLKKVNFTCRKCGNYCYNIFRKVEIKLSRIISIRHIKLKIN